MDKLYQLAVVNLLVLLFTTTPLIGAMPDKGSDGNLEWRTLTNLDFGAKAIDFVNSLDGKYVFILTRDQRVLVYDQKGTLQGSIPVEAGVTGIDVAPQGQLLHLIDTEKNQTTTLVIDYVVSIDTANSAYKGDIDAPVEIVVFSDFE